MQNGFVTALKLERGFGFIGQEGGQDVYFHSSELTGGLEFDARLQGQRVQFNVMKSERGPRAIGVRPAE